jgi:broad specificity phosphatase PhoE
MAERRPRPELVVSSPLRRALLTASLAYEALPEVPRLVAPLAAARHRHTSDVGSSPAQLRSLFEGHPWDFDGLEDDWWPPVPETDEQFYGRLMKLGHWLLERPEENITLVCHWGVIHGLTLGYDAENCEVVTTRLTAKGFEVLPEAMPEESPVGGSR